jgi:hypothetical protein
MRKPWGRSSTIRERPARTLPALTRAGTKMTAVAASAGVVLLSVGAAFAGAAPSAPHWKIHVIPLPSRFAVGHTTDEYTILVTNTGAAPSAPETPVIIREALSGPIEAVQIVGTDWVSGEPLECTEEALTQPLQCTDPGPVPPDDTLAITVSVKATAPVGTANAETVAEGGGAPAASATTQTTIGSEPSPFAISDFKFEATGLDGELDGQAASHPYEQTTSFELLSNANENVEEAYRPAENPRDLAITLPDGFIGNPSATPQCTLSRLEEAAFNEQFDFVPQCSRASRVGLITLVDGRSAGATGTTQRGLRTTALYNLAPEAGHAAELGFVYLQYAVVLYADVVYSEGRYRVRVSAPGLPVIDLDGASVTIFGNPGAHGGESADTSAFLRNPSHCSAEPSTSKLEVDSWERPHSWLGASQVAYSSITGCELLRFQPEIAIKPEASGGDGSAAGTVLADSPKGYEIDIKVPHAETSWPLLASPELRSATVTLPPGLNISPSAATALEGCAPNGPHGIEMPHGMSHPDEAGEGEVLGPDGLSHLAPGHCPSGSEIGHVEIRTPLLGHPLDGAIYVAEPGCGRDTPCTEEQAESGEMLRVYIEAEGSGVDVKLAGVTEVGGYGPHSRTTGLQPGQLRVRFLENPQLPVSDIEVRLYGGQRAALASPQNCGPAAMTSALEPWSDPGETATPSSSLQVVGCPTVQPFAPSFSAGTLTPLAGGSSPFTTTVARHDGEQGLSRITVKAAPGVAARLASISPCNDDGASAGACPPASQVGHIDAAAGPGAEPFWTRGTVYLTGPYEGAPFGLEFVVPAKAGPFNLGNVVTRAALRIDPYTGAASVVSDALPLVLDGIPLRLKTVSVSLDRPDFMINPTNCSPHEITGSLVGAPANGSAGAVERVSTPYAVAGCRGLTFKPRFTATTTGRTSKARGASLRVHVAASPGEANIRKVKVDLPKQLPSRLTTLQKACTEATFAANAAACPDFSVVGTATAVTPVLRHPLAGPAYLVSHGGAAFPDLDVVLQGEGVTIILTGNTRIRHGVTSSTFDAVPDAPISSFDLNLPEGPHSILASFLPAKAKGSMCGLNLRLPNIFTGQNGAEVKGSTKIAVAGCHKRKARPRRRAKRSLGRPRSHK